MNDKANGHRQRKYDEVGATEHIVRRCEQGEDDDEDEEVTCAQNGDSSYAQQFVASATF